MQKIAYLIINSIDTKAVMPFN